jgi:calcineurin-like phosphoesterase family protein
MNERMVFEWNEEIKDEDEIIYMGDFGNMRFLKKLNGKKYLLLGNYEREMLKANPTLIDHRVWEDMGWSEVHLEALYLVYGVKLTEESTVDAFSKLRGPVDKNLVISHEPSNIPKSLRDSSECFCLFGHIHNTQMVKRWGLNVGADCHHFKPISIDTVDFYYNAIRRHYDDEVFMS